MPTMPFLLLILCLPLSQSRETCPEPLLLYSFTSKQCENSIIQNEGTKLTPTDIVLVDGKTECSPSLGIEATGLLSSVGVYSNDSVGDMMNDISLNGEGISIAVWFKPFLDTQDTAIRPLLTVGRLKEFEQSVLAPPGINRCVSHEFNLQIAQRAGAIEIFFRTRSHLFEGCQQYRVESPLLPDRMAHLVVSLQDGRQQAFLNGNPGPLLSEPFPGNISHWHSSARLYMFSSPFVESPWLGTLYQLSLLSGGLGPAEVLGCLQAGLPRTNPYGFDYSVTINEDAANLALPHAMECSAGEASSLGAEQIELRVGSIDDEIGQLLQEVDLTAPSTIDHKYYLYVTSLPSLGRLVQFDGTPIESQLQDATLPVLVSSKDSTVKYIPPQDAHSSDWGVVFDGFSYCVAAKPMINSRMCSPGNVQLHVRAVNDPPVALKVGPILITEGPASYDTPKIRLAGYDVDQGDTLQNVQITQAPRHGRLLLGVYSFRKDGLGHGTAISELNYTVNADDPVYVEYVWSPDPILPVVGDHPSRDDFLFRVSDNHGCWSAEEKVQVVVTSALLALASPSSAVEASPGAVVSLNWLATDYSGFRRELAFYVVSAPSYEIGMLVNPETQSGVQTGSLVKSSRHFRNQFASMVTFEASEVVCSPDTDGFHRANAEIVVQAVALDHDAVVSTSNSLSQSIRLRCDTGTPLAMTVPATQTVMGALSLRRAASRDCLQQRRTCGTSFDGIVFEQYRTGTEEVTVIVSSRAGCISFADSVWRHVKPLSGRRALASGSISFLADKFDLTDIFSGMIFQSFAEGNDVVEIRVVIGECLQLATVEEHSCIELAQVISLLVLKEDDNFASQRLPQPRFPWHVVMCFLGYPALYYFLRKVESPRCNSE